MTDNGFGKLSMQVDDRDIDIGQDDALAVGRDDDAVPGVVRPVRFARSGSGSNAYPPDAERRPGRRPWVCVRIGVRRDGLAIASKKAGSRCRKAEFWTP